VSRPAKSGNTMCHGSQKVRIQCPAEKGVSCHENRADHMGRGSFRKNLHPYIVSFHFGIDAAVIRIYIQSFPKQKSKHFLKGGRTGWFY
jgi:hypothetical protein